MATILTSTLFRSDNVHLVQDFDCGRDHEYQTELSDWIKHESLLAMENGVSIWLYWANEEIAGFGALGLGELQLDADEIVEVQNIPALAVQLTHQRRGFFHQIVEHLIAEARKRIDATSSLLTLEVHPENFVKDAYRKKGFVRCPGADYFDERRNIRYEGMLMDLRQH